MTDKDSFGFYREPGMGRRVLIHHLTDVQTAEYNKLRAWLRQSDIDSLVVKAGLKALRDEVASISGGQDLPE